LKHRSLTKPISRPSLFKSFLILH